MRCDIEKNAPTGDIYIENSKERRKSICSSVEYFAEAYLRLASLPCGCTSSLCFHGCEFEINVYSYKFLICNLAGGASGVRK